MAEHKMVSVVIPAYNRETTIVRAIESVLQQTYSPLECVIVDDCSADNTEMVVKEKFGNDTRVRYYKLPQNSGACVARNTGIEISRGYYVAFLDSDDKYKPEKIEKQIRAIEESGVQFCSTAFEGISRNGDRSIRLPYHGTKEEILTELLYLNCITTGVLCGKRECLLETPFDPNQPRYQDWDIALRLFKKYDFVFLDDVTLELIYQPNSISSTTSHEKTLRALRMLYGKNEDDFNKDRRANAQIHWLMGLHSLFVPGQKDKKSLWKGVVGNGFSFHRFAIYISLCLGLKKIFSKQIQHI